MNVIKFTFVDNIGNEPMKENWANCEINNDDIPNVISRLNGLKWRFPVDLSRIKKKIYALYNCELLKTRKVTEGGYIGGPIGKRKMIYPTVVEYPFDKEIKEVNTKIKCSQEGSHLFCSLD